MNIDNTISGARIKKALTPKTIAIVALSVVLVATCFYITIENRDSKEILIWFITTDTDAPFSDDALTRINDYGSQRGIDKIVLTRRHPEDKYFDAAMSTSAFYNCDIFIMREEMVKKYADLGMFLPLSTEGVDTDNLLYCGNDAVGILIDEDYYLLINAKTDIALEIIYDILDILIHK